MLSRNGTNPYGSPHNGWALWLVRVRRGCVCGSPELRRSLLLVRETQAPAPRIGDCHCASSDLATDERARRAPSSTLRMRLNVARVRLHLPVQRPTLSLLFSSTSSSASPSSSPSPSSSTSSPLRARRTYASQASGGTSFNVFNTHTKWLQKERAAANADLSRQADYLKDEVAMRVCERLLVRPQPTLLPPLISRP